MSDRSIEHAGASDIAPSSRPSAITTPPRDPTRAHAGAALDRRAERWVAVAGVTLFAWLVGSALVVAWGLHEVRALVALERNRSSATEPASAALPSSTPSAPPRTEPAPPPPLPDSTRTRAEGDLEVIELGRSAAALSTTLREEGKRAHEAGRSFLVLVTEEGECAPCRGVDRALEDPLLHQALGRVRLVRVARTAFREELLQMGIAAELVPMFLRFDDGLGLVDAIHGGEWDEDVTPNIAPVLAAFVRGTYRVRRHPRWTPATGSVRL